MIASPAAAGQPSRPIMSRRPLPYLRAGILAALLVIAGVSTPAAGSATPPLRELASPAGNGSQASNLTTGPDGTVCLTWSEPVPGAPDSRALRVARLLPGRDRWETPRTIVATPQLMENWADFATLSVGTDGAWTAVWFQVHADGTRGYEGWCARSRNAGETWSSPMRLGHEFVSLAPLSGGRTLAVWLESLRIPAENRRPGIPTMELRSCVIGADGALGPVTVVDPDVCNCCQTTLASLPGECVLVAYRGHTPGEIRDIRMAEFSSAGWSAPRDLHADGWQIAGCPVNGPAVDAARKHVAATWFTAAGGTPRVRARYSADGGATWAAPLEVDAGQPLGRLDLVMLPDHSAVVTWLERQAGASSAALFARRIFPDGQWSMARRLADSSEARVSGFPRTTSRLDGRLVLAWTDPEGGTRVRTALIDPSQFTPETTGPRTVQLRPHRAVPVEFCVAPSPETRHASHP